MAASSSPPLSSVISLFKDRVSIFVSVSLNPKLCINVNGAERRGLSSSFLPSPPPLSHKNPKCHQGRYGTKFLNPESESLASKGKSSSVKEIRTAFSSPLPLQDGTESNSVSNPGTNSKPNPNANQQPRLDLKIKPSGSEEDGDGLWRGERRERGRFLRNDVGPNAAVLEAQAKVCTGPTQTRPLDEDTMTTVLDLILRSAKGEVRVEERVSHAQMGAFFGAMTLRASSSAFPPATSWSEGEFKAMASYWPDLRKYLPKDILFLADPEGSIMGGGGESFLGSEGGGDAEERVVGALREVLEGGHLGFEETKAVLQDVLPMRGERGREERGAVSDGLIAAFLICQRMNRETDRELKAYCMAFADELGPAPLADVRSLTHYGEPYDGNTRFFRSTLFVAAVRASYGEACLLHGVDLMPPKGGVTEEQMLRHMGAATSLSPAGAARLLEDPEVGMAYVSLREGRPSLYTLTDMRLHIKKRPPLATTEKVQRFVKASGREAMMASFYHEGYEEPLLMLIRRQAVEAALVIKGEEGSLSLMTRPRAADLSVKGRPVNYCAGFRPLTVTENSNIENVAGFHRETFSAEVDPSHYGFEPTPTPRVDRSAVANLELGLRALRGERGAAYDRIVFNAAMADHLLGCQGASDPTVAIARSKDAIDSGRALKVLEAYVRKSRQIAL